MGGDSHNEVYVEDDKWYLDKKRALNTPSVLANMSIDEETYERQCCASLIQDLGQILRLNQIAINTALVYMHRFYTYQPMHLFNRNDAQQFSKRICYYETALVLNLNAELVVQHPHVFVLDCSSQNGFPDDVTHTAYFLASNSLHLTRFCIIYKPSEVACICLYLAGEWAAYLLQDPNSDTMWWHCIAPNFKFEQIKDAALEFVDIMETCPARIKKILRISPMMTKVNELLERTANNKRESDGDTENNIIIKLDDYKKLKKTETTQSSTNQNTSPPNKISETKSQLHYRLEKAWEAEKEDETARSVELPIFKQSRKHSRSESVNTATRVSHKKVKRARKDLSEGECTSTDCSDSEENSCDTSQKRKGLDNEAMDSLIVDESNKIINLDDIGTDAKASETTSTSESRCMHDLMNVNSCVRSNSKENIPTTTVITNNALPKTDHNNRETSHPENGENTNLMINNIQQENYFIVNTPLDHKDMENNKEVKKGPLETEGDMNQQYHSGFSSEPCPTAYHEKSPPTTKDFNENNSNACTIDVVCEKNKSTFKSPNTQISQDVSEIVEESHVKNNALIVFPNNDISPADFNKKTENNLSDHLKGENRNSTMPFLECSNVEFITSISPTAKNISESDVMVLQDSSFKNGAFNDNCTDSHKLTHSEEHFNDVLNRITVENKIDSLSQSIVSRKRNYVGSNYKASTTHKEENTTCETKEAKPEESDVMVSPKSIEPEAQVSPFNNTEKRMLNGTNVEIDTVEPFKKASNTNICNYNQVLVSDLNDKAPQTDDDSVTGNQNHPTENDQIKFVLQPPLGGNFNFHNVEFNNLGKTSENDIGSNVENGQFLGLNKDHVSSCLSNNKTTQNGSNNYLTSNDKESSPKNNNSNNDDS